MIRIKIILFLLIMFGFSYILERITKDKFQNNLRLKIITFSTIVSSFGFVLGFIIFYLLS